ncbi:sigma-54 interaction domain-containing protein [Cytobacillus sp. FJAT-54145]|uniref:Sigma-54 interaction domain-containing protein n=1 Tax=Cytobacillus spartinae TaxID=3299023 RepID=A0ABW6KD45_9BACI
MIGKPDISKEVLTAILTEIDEGIHVVDTDGITIFYNEVAAKHDGLTVEEVLGKPLLDVFPSLNEDTSTLLKVLKTKTTIMNQAQSYTNIHGKKIETMNTTIPIIVNDELVGAMEIAKDYTSIKRLSEQLIDLQKDMQSRSKTTYNKSSVLYSLEDLLSVNQDFLKMKEEAFKLAKSHSSILVFGESGTGKELFVQGIHHASRRGKKAFIAQNCAAIPETLLESVLFGTAKGSYTGAIERPGLFELADGGTLFLDELHAMPIDLQAKLLRVLEDGVVRRVGGTKNIVVNVRVIAAMNIHPKEALKTEQLRADLFYRLNVLTFELLPLRKRKDDIIFLLEHFINGFNMSLNKRVRGVTDEVKSLFISYPWPGNVRELKHAVEYMMNISEEDILTVEHLPIMLKEQSMLVHHEPSNETYSLRKKVYLYEKQLIERTLDQTGGNIKKAAVQLQIPRQTLQYKIQKYTNLDAE